MIYAVISEFNPFHNGHQYLLSQLPKTETDYTVCIMSGHFVQRGEPAAYSKWERASAAIRNGADLVLELPVPYVLSNSERFAETGVQLAAALGQPVTMAFGTEEGSLAALERLAALSEETLAPFIKKELDQGRSYGAARQEALMQLLPEESALLLKPNNLLAYGYLKAARPLQIPCLTIQRSAPHSGEPQGIYCSASFVREHPETFDQYCPCRQGPALDKNAAEIGLLSLLRTTAPDQWAQTANISEGLENRILSALTRTNTLQNLLEESKTKRYSMAKLRRALCAVALQLPRELPAQTPPYLRPLAFNQRGRELLKSLKKTAALPITQSGKECEAASLAFFEVERRATDLWNCWSSSPAPAGEDYRQSPIYHRFE